jgi:hypothetical protein
MPPKNEELARYEQLMKDWKPAAAPGKKKKAAKDDPVEALRVELVEPLMAAPVQPKATPMVPTTAQVAWQPGMILSINDRTLAVYKKPIAGSDVHLVALLCPNGFVKSQGISLEGLKVEEIGSLAGEWFKQFETQTRWERDLIVFHCYRYEDTFRIPVLNMVAATESRGPESGSDFGEKAVGSVNESTDEPGRNVALDDPKTEETRDEESSVQSEDLKAGADIKHEPEPAEPEDPLLSLKRGQRIQIKMGVNLWDAVFWGCDARGMVVAHQTNGQWSLMHLELQRYRDSIKIDPNIDESLVGDIQDSVTK